MIVSIPQFCHCASEDLFIHQMPNGDSRGGTAGCSLMTNCDVRHVTIPFSYTFSE